MKDQIKLPANLGLPKIKFDEVFMVINEAYETAISQIGLAQKRIAELEKENAELKLNPPNTPPESP